MIDMKHTDKRFDKEEESLPKRMEGSRLLAIDAVLAAPPDNSWNTVRLHFDNFDIDINNALHDIVVDELGTLEEFGILSITKATKKTLNIPEVGADTSVFKIGTTVKRVTVINDIADIYGDGALVARTEYPQAIALHTGSEVIMIDTEVWFSEMIAIKKGRGIDELLYDDSANWENDPGEDPSTHFEFRTETQHLQFARKRSNASNPAPSEPRPKRTAEAPFPEQQKKRTGGPAKPVPNRAAPPENTK